MVMLDFFIIKNVDDFLLLSESCPPTALESQVAVETPEGYCSAKALQYYRSVTQQQELVGSSSLCFMHPCLDFHVGLNNIQLPACRLAIYDALKLLTPAILFPSLPCCQKWDEWSM